METNSINLPTQTKDSELAYFVFDELERTQPSIQDYPPSLYSILDSNGSFSSPSLVIGLCNDGLPFTLNLDNPKSGSILIVGDRRKDIAQLMKVIGHSVSLINHPQEVSFYVITSKPNDYFELLSYTHCQEILSAEDRSAGGLINDLASIAAQRRISGEGGSKTILFIDDLSSISNLLNDFRVYLNFQSLIQRGPKSGIWPIVSSTKHDVEHAKPHLARMFRTKIFDKYNSTLSASPAFNELSDQETLEFRFNVIIKGRLIPIDNLTI
jgi:hypothetical protein